MSFPGDEQEKIRRVIQKKESRKKGFDRRHLFFILNPFLMSVIILRSIILWFIISDIHITAMRQIGSLALACLTKVTTLTTLEIRPGFTAYFI